MTTMAPTVEFPHQIQTGKVSTDLRYLQHEFVTFQGGSHWTNGWTPSEAREAVNMHLRGQFWLSAALARDVVRYPPIMAALLQRMGPALRTRWTVQGSDRAPGRFAREDMRRAWKSFRYFYQDVLRDLALMGLSWIHIHWNYNEDGVLFPTLKRWPLEAVSWCGYSPASPQGYYASTVDSGFVPMVHGDAHWMMIGNGERPHELGAIVALGESYISGQLGRRDESGLSAAAGRASPIAELPPGVSTGSEAGLEVQKVVAGLGLARQGAVVPHQTEIHSFSIVSDTTFFKDKLTGDLQHVAFAMLGQAGTMSPGTGGVYTAPVFEGVAEALVGGQQEATERGFTTGVAEPHTELNYPGAEPPRLVGKRVNRAPEYILKLSEIVKAERDAGFDVTQERVNAHAETLGVDAPTLAAAQTKYPRIDLAQTDKAKVFLAREVRAGEGYPPLGDERDELTIPELDAMAAKDAAPEAEAEQESEDAEDES